MAEGLSSCLPIAMRMVGDAIRLDSQNCKKEAYCQYLSCCIYISQILKDDAWDKDIKLAYNKDSAKLLKLIQQCQERALTIISTEGSQPASSPTLSPVLPRSQTSLPTPQDNQRKLSDSSSPPGSASMGHLFRTSSGQLLNFPSPPSSLPNSGYGNNSTKPAPPCPRANYQDRRLMGHHLRVARFNTTETDKTLTSLRRMAENIQIAKAREEAIRKKVWERQQRLQQEANRRFGSAGIDSKGEQEQRALYTKILEYEQDMVWPRQLRAKLKESPEDASLIKHVIEKIFSSKDHPLRQFLLQYQYYVYKKLLPLMKDVNFPNDKSLNNKSNGGDLSNNKTAGENGVCPLNKDDIRNDDTDRTVSNNETRTKEEESVDEDKGNHVVVIDVNADESDELATNKPENLNDNNLTQDNNDKTINYEQNVSKITSEDQEDKTINIDGTCQDKKGKFQQEFPHEDVLAIVTSVVEEIIERVTNTDNDPQTNKNRQQNHTFLDDKNDDNDLEGEHVEDRQEVFPTEDTTTWDDKDTTKETDIDTERSETVDTSNGSSKEIKNRNLMKIKSFDVESEFESLEDDMFDSESDDEEEEEQEENTVESGGSSNENIDEGASSNETLSHNDSELVAEGENKHDINRDNEGSVTIEPVKDGSPEQNEPIISEEEELEMTRKQLNEIFVDMRFFLEKLKGFIILAYEELATPVGHDQCYAAVECPFFQPLWPLLLGVLRRVNFEKELSLGSIMTKQIRFTPAEMGVIDRLCLSDQEVLKATGNQFPYQLAIDQLHKVATSHCPLEKLEYIVHVLRSICQCVEDYWEGKGKPRHCPETSIGCDDLLPVLTYVIIRSGMAQLVSECVAMEEFIPEGYLMGEEGYCLTTLQTALAYLVHLEHQTTEGKTQDLS